MSTAVDATAASPSIAPVTPSSSLGGGTSNSSALPALPTINYPAPLHPLRQLSFSTIMLAPPQHEHRDAPTATIAAQQSALDRGYSLQVKSAVIRCSRSGHPTHKVGASSEGPGRKASKTNCPFEAVIVKTANGAKVTVKHDDHNHDVDRDIGIKYWRVLTKEEKEVVKAMKARDDSLEVGQVKSTINRVRAQHGLPALNDSKSISNLFRKLKKAAARSLPPGSPPPHSSPPRATPARSLPPRGSSTRFGPARAADTTTSTPASSSLSSPAAVTSSSGLPALDQGSQLLSSDLRLEGQIDAVDHELDDLRSELSNFFASSSVSSIDPAHVARSGFVAMVGAMLLQRDQAL